MPLRSYKATSPGLRQMTRSTFEEITTKEPYKPLLEAQIRGSALWGASQIMSEKLTLKNGGFEQSNFHEYTPIRLAQVPEIDVTIIQSDRHPAGVGEPASTVVAPAVANAIYNAIGVRVRHMPISPQSILDGLKKA